MAHQYADRRVCWISAGLIKTEGTEQREEAILLPTEKGSRKMTRQERYPNTETFVNYNANPKGRITDDCVVRAICTAMRKPYEEVSRDLFEIGVKTGYTMYDDKVYGKYLEQNGWIKMRQPRKANGRKYTGKEFCDYGRIKTEADRRMIAHIGGHHIVAIIEGRVWDTWDSTDGCIGNYWIKG